LYTSKITSTLKVYTIDTAPEESKSLLEHSRKMYGAIPCTS